MSPVGMAADTLLNDKLEKVLNKVEHVADDAFAAVANGVAASAEQVKGGLKATVHGVLTGDMKEAISGMASAAMGGVSLLPSQLALNAVATAAGSVISDVIPGKAGDVLGSVATTAVQMRGGKAPLGVVVDDQARLAQLSKMGRMNHPAPMETSIGPADIGIQKPGLHTVPSQEVSSTLEAFHRAQDKLALQSLSLEMGRIHHPTPMGIGIGPADVGIQKPGPHTVPSQEVSSTLEAFHRAQDKLALQSLSPEVSSTLEAFHQQQDKLAQLSASVVMPKPAPFGVVPPQAHSRAELVAHAAQQTEAMQGLVDKMAQKA
jgi:hypothetical protein